MSGLTRRLALVTPCLLLVGSATQLRAQVVQQATLSATSISFGSQGIGTISSVKTITLTNNLNTPLTITSATASGDFATTTAPTNPCGSSLAAGGRCSIGVTFSPTQLGTRTGTLTVTDSASNSPQTANLTGTGVLQATLSATSISFGSQGIGTISSVKTITLTNNLNTPLTITSATASGDFATTTAPTNPCGSSLAAGGRCSIGVTFSPTQLGTRTGTLTVTDSASNSPQTANLTGTGVLQATLSATSISFGSQGIGTISSVKTITLTNNLNTPLTITSATASGDFATTTAPTNPCGSSLAAGGRCSIGVTFSPTQLGTRTGTLTVTDSASNSPQTANLTGTGVLQATLSATSISFGSQGIGTISSVKTITLTNDLNTPLTITSATASGDFATTTAPTNPCGSSLAAGGRCSIGVTFSPTQLGTRT